MKATGHVGMEEPFAGLFTQGMVVHETYKDSAGQWVAPADVRIDTPRAPTSPDLDPLKAMQGVEIFERRATRISDGGPIWIGPIEKMSKSKKNVVDPNDIIETYGADTARWFVLSDSPPDRDVIWTEAGVDGASKRVQRIWRLASEAAARGAPNGATAPAETGEAATALRRAAHGALARVGDGVERFHFNICIAAINELSNALSQALQQAPDKPSEDMAFAMREAAEILVQIVAPFTPHLAEESWAALGHGGLVAETPWPEADASLLESNVVTLPVQVNGKKRDEIVVPREADAATIEKMVRELEAVLKAVGDKPIRKVIVVPQRIVNVVA